MLLYLILHLNIVELDIKLIKCYIIKMKKGEFMEKLNEENFLNYCIDVRGITTFHPIYNETSKQPLETPEGMARKYDYNNGILAFVGEDGSYYVTPFCGDIIPLIEEEGYEHKKLYVPFSNFDIPSDEKLAKLWEELRTEAIKLFKQNQIERENENIAAIAAAKAEDQGLQELPAETYEESLEIPINGLETTSMFSHENQLTKPVEYDQMEKCLGTYTQNNGLIAFVDDKGKTYVSPFSEKTKSSLETAGYKMGYIWVPLSNGEEIVDPAIAAKWEQMCINARQIQGGKK